MRGKLEITVFIVDLGPGHQHGQWEATLTTGIEESLSVKNLDGATARIDSRALFNSLRNHLSEYLSDDELLVEITTLPSIKIVGGTNAYHKRCYLRRPIPDALMNSVGWFYNQFLENPEPEEVPEGPILESVESKDFVDDKYNGSAGISCDPNERARTRIINSMAN